MKNKLLLIFLLLVFCFSIFPIEAFATEQALPSGISDSEIGEQIDAYLEEHKDTTAAVSIAVFRGNATLYKTGYGYANIEDQLLVDDETVYEWGSVSKLLVWVSVMQLWEQGKIELDKDVSEYLPQGFLTKLKQDMPITMKNLMNHNAGWEDVVFQMISVDAGSLLPLEDALKATEPRQVYIPGEVCSYSNWGVALAGYIVERISGQPFYEYVQEHIFKPLDMKHSSLSPLYSDNPWVQSKLLENEGYSTDLVPIGDGLMYINLYPAGSAAGTLDDFITFAKALVPNSMGSTQLFRKGETHTEMFSSTLSYPGTNIDYNNHGFWSYEFDVQTLGHGGNTIMYSSHLMIDPISGVGLVIMTNQKGELTYNYGLPPIVFGQLGQMVLDDGRAETAEIAGLYYSARTVREGIGKMYTILGLRQYFDDGDNGLHASLFNVLKIEGRQIAANTFIITQQAGTVKMDYLARYSKNDGIKMMSSAYGDELEADSSVKVLIISLILYIIAVLWSGSILISSLIRFIIRKFKKKEHVSTPFKKYQIMLCVAVMASVVIIILVAGMMFSTKALTKELIPYIVASIVLGLTPFAYAFLLLTKWRKLSCSKMQKVVYVLSMCMGFAMTFTIFALEMYKL